MGWVEMISEKVAFHKRKLTPLLTQLLLRGWKKSSGYQGMNSSGHLG